MLTMANGTFVKVFGWYDNEWGYSCRLVDLIVNVLVTCPARSRRPTSRVGRCWCGRTSTSRSRTAGSPTTPGFAGRCRRCGCCSTVVRPRSGVARTSAGRRPTAVCLTIMPVRGRLPELLPDDRVTVLENTRFNPGETKKDDEARPRAGRSAATYVRRTTRSDPRTGRTRRRGRRARCCLRTPACCCSTESSSTSARCSATSSGRL